MNSPLVYLTGKALEGLLAARGDKALSSELTMDEYTDKIGQSAAKIALAALKQLQDGRKP